MSEKQVNEFKTLPLITLRGLTITPHSNVQIIAARDQSIEAFKAAIESDSREIAIFCQLFDTDEAPSADRLQKIGVLCHVLSGDSRIPDNYRSLIYGFKRIKLLNIIDDPKIRYRQAEIAILEEPQIDEKTEKEHLDALQSALLYAMQHSENCARPLIDGTVPNDMVENIKNQQKLNVLTDMLCQVLTLDPAEKRQMLETLSAVDRAKVLIALLNGYSYKAELDNRIREEARLSMEKNQKDYYLNEQLKAIKHELDLDIDDEDEIAEYKEKLKNLKAPQNVKKKIEKELKKLSAMNNNAAEGTIVRNYIDTLLNIPWEQGDEVNTDLIKAREVLDADHYGLEKVKDRILEFLAVQSRTDNNRGSILCLMGPPGIGKTSLCASIAKATGRRYVRVALGGMHDESEIRGHRRTYIGAMPGRIIQNISKVGVNNPLFLLDEIDKVSNSLHGDPESALLEVLDPEQNKNFADNYVELEYDLSKVFFIATANSYNIAQPLLDRMEIIDLSSYTEDEKFHIAKEHLIKKQMNLTALTDKEFSINDDAIYELIRYYTHEAGVRGLERIINELCRKTVKEMMMSKTAKKTKSVKKRIITVKSIEKLLGPRRFDFTSKLKENKVGLVNGLAWTSLGGDILQLEAVANEGKGKHLLTGKLGEVMKESISAATTLVRSRSSLLHLDKEFFEKCDLHIHVPEGATPKEGPSAGVGMVTAIVSAITGNPVRADVAMTGEITLRGDVLPIGGLKEKLLAALRGGIKIALIPKDNEKDLWDIPANVKRGMKIIPVGKIDEVLKIALVNDPFSFIPTTVWKEQICKSNEENSGKVIPQA